MTSLFNTIKNALIVLIFMTSNTNYTMEDQDNDTISFTTTDGKNLNLTQDQISHFLTLSNLVACKLEQPISLTHIPLATEENIKNILKITENSYTRLSILELKKKENALDKDIKNLKDNRALYCKERLPTIKNEITNSLAEELSSKIKSLNIEITLMSDEKSVVSREIQKKEFNNNEIKPSAWEIFRKIRRIFKGMSFAAFLEATYLVRVLQVGVDEESSKINDYLPKLIDGHLSILPFQDDDLDYINKKKIPIVYTLFDDAKRPYKSLTFDNNEIIDPNTYFNSITKESIFIKRTPKDIQLMVVNFDQEKLTRSMKISENIKSLPIYFDVDSSNDRVAIAMYNAVKIYDLTTFKTIQILLGVNNFRKIQFSSKGTFFGAMEDDHLQSLAVYEKRDKEDLYRPFAKATNIKNFRFISDNKFIGKNKTDSYFLYLLDPKKPPYFKNIEPSQKITVKENDKKDLNESSTPIRWSCDENYASHRTDSKPMVISIDHDPVLMEVAEKLKNDEQRWLVFFCNYWQQNDMLIPHQYRELYNTLPDRLKFRFNALLTSNREKLQQERFEKREEYQRLELEKKQKLEEEQRLEHQKIIKLYFEEEIERRELRRNNLRMLQEQNKLLEEKQKLEKQKLEKQKLEEELRLEHQQRIIKLCNEKKQFKGFWEKRTPNQAKTLELRVFSAKRSLPYTFSLLTPPLEIEELK